jgi:5-hydroxyisourate hydrolase
MGQLSTHVLDTTHGRPAQGMAFELWRVKSEGAERLAQGTLDADGRTGAPLLEGAAYLPGTYELVFMVGEYFTAIGTKQSDPPFLDAVTLRFTLAEPDGDYHVPLLCSPWSYTTYRGS